MADGAGSDPGEKLAFAVVGNARFATSESFSPPFRGPTSSLPVTGPECGTIRLANTIAAGALMKDAARMWPSALGTKRAVLMS